MLLLLFVGPGGEAPPVTTLSVGPVLRAVEQLQPGLTSAETLTPETKSVEELGPEIEDTQEL